MVLISNVSICSDSDILVIAHTSTTPLHSTPLHSGGGGGSSTSNLYLTLSNHASIYAVVKLRSDP
uniref:Uncharacterized protein n=1 Tax=Kalanchoe fedtschenkoi TaxID=63787 RepID=A0A7N0VGK1_KALFE